MKIGYFIGLLLLIYAHCNLYVAEQTMDRIESGLTTIEGLDN